MTNYELAESEFLWVTSQTLLDDYRISGGPPSLQGFQILILISCLSCIRWIECDRYQTENVNFLFYRFYLNGSGFCLQIQYRR